MGNMKLVPILIFLFFTSCNKNVNSGLGPIDYGIVPNTIPWINISIGDSPYFLVNTVTTLQNFNIGVNCDDNYVNTITNNNNQLITVGNVEAIFPTNNNEYYQGNVMYATGCTFGYRVYGPSSNITLDAPAWSLNSSQQVPVDTVYIDTTTPPVVPSLICPDTLSTKSAFTLHRSGIISTDSVVFIIQGSINRVTYKLAPGTDSCLFTAQQMLTLGTTGSANIKTGQKAGLVQIITFKYHKANFFGRNCYFIKEACFSKYVVLV